MTKWEHLELQYMEAPNGVRDLVFLSGPDYMPRPVTLDQGQQGSPALRHLDELGREGWELVATEPSVVGDRSMRQYWLKRPAVEAATGHAHFR